MTSVTHPVPPMAIEPTAPTWYRDDVHAAYTWLRAEAPVYEYQPGRFLVARYHDVREVSAAPRRFVSGQGVLITQAPTDVDPGNSPSIIQMDPPKHTAYRKIVSRAFTPRAVRRLEPRIREITRRCLDEISDPSAVDIVEQIAVPVPVLVIAELLGIPVEDRERFREWSDAVIEVADEGPEAFERVGQLMAYFATHIEEHRRNPQHDILTQLVDAEVDGHRLSEAELQMFLLTLLVAGNETTRNLISGGCLTLTEHPDQLARLVADPSLVPTAVEEMLRWVTPVMSFSRTVTGDDELAGVSLRSGDYLTLLYASANRDESVWGPTASTFDVGRPADPAHVTFGFGEHHCLGAALARLEARVVFEELLGRYEGHLSLRGDPSWLESTLMNSVSELPASLAA